MLLELFGGIFTRSLALLGDAGHMLTDSMALALSYLAMQWSKKPATSKKTFGYHRFEILAALINRLSLLAISGYIAYEAVQRFFHPVEVKSISLIIIASAGFIGNLAGVLLLRHENHDNLNIRGAFLHLLGDMLSSIGVIAGGLIIYLTGWNAVDSIIGVMIAGVVLRSAIGLIIESSDVLLEAVPRDIDIAQLKKSAEAVAGVREFHDIHIWSIKSGLRALSAHVLVGDISARESQSIVSSVRIMLKERYNISHTTIEVECDACKDDSCDYKN